MTRDRGSATVYVLAAAAVVLAAGGVGAEVGAAVVARHRAASAADLAALAAASTALRGGPACAVAGRVVRANAGQLAGCQLIGPDAVVTAEVAPAGIGRSWGTARVSARAGPAGGSISGRYAVR